MKILTLPRFLVLFFIAILLSMGITSCTPERVAEDTLANETTTEATDEDTEYIVDEDVDEDTETYTDEGVDEDTDEEKIVYKDTHETSDDEVTEVIAAIRKALYNGNYPKAVELSQQEDSFLSSYYRGIAYYIMAIQPEKYDVDTRSQYIDLAIEELKMVAFEANQESLKARGTLWYAVANHVGYKDLTHKKQSIGALYRFEKTSLQDSPYYNDAMLYTGYIYAQMGWYGTARNYMYKAGNVDNDDKVYDYTQNNFLTAEEASERGLEVLDEYMSGTHSDYK